MAGLSQITWMHPLLSGYNHKQQSQRKADKKTPHVMVVRIVILYQVASAASLAKKGRQSKSTWKNSGKIF